MSTVSRAGMIIRKKYQSYDDEKRRIESWLGNYMKFHQTADGKNVFCQLIAEQPDTIHFIRHGRQRALQMEILPFILLLWIFFLMDKNCHLGMSHIRWTNIWQGLSMQEYLTSLRSEKTQRICKRRIVGKTEEWKDDAIQSYRRV